MKRQIFIIITLMLLSGCTPQQKLTRLINRYPELTTRFDTLVVSDTIIREGATKEIILDLPCPDLLDIAEI